MERLSTPRRRGVASLALALASLAATACGTEPEEEPTGVDVTGPGGQSYHYEILSGTESNFALHGRRMASTFFRMIFF